MCEICSAIVKLSALSQHLQSHEKRFKCYHCDKRFACEKAFLAHKSNYHNEAVKVDSGKKPLLTCSFCSIKFEAPVQLEKHLRSHTKSKPFQCSSCSKSFVSKSNLSAHQRIHEGTALRCSCDQCDKKFRHPIHHHHHLTSSLSTYSSWASPFLQTLRGARRRLQALSPAHPWHFEEDHPAHGLLGCLATLHKCSKVSPLSVGGDRKGKGECLVKII